MSWDFKALTIGAKKPGSSSKIIFKSGGQECPPHTAYGTLVVLPGGYQSDLGEASSRYYVGCMALVLMMVVLAFGLLYVAVVAEERQMQEATKPRKR